MTDNTWPTVDTELIDDVTLYSAKLIIPVTGPVIIDGAVAIHGDRVVHVGKRRWVLKALKQEMTAHGTIRERHWDGVLTPGLVNAHTHLQYSGMVQVGQGTYDRFRAWELAFNEVYAEAQRLADVYCLPAQQRGTQGLADNIHRLAGVIEQEVDIISGAVTHLFNH